MSFITLASGSVSGYVRPVRVVGESVGDLTIQDTSEVQGAIIYDCRPPLLPVSLQLKDIGPLPLRPAVVSASLAAPPWEDGPGRGSYSGAWRCTAG